MTRILRLLPLLLTLVSTQAAALPRMLDNDNEALRKAFTTEKLPEGASPQEQRVLDRIKANEQRKEEQQKRAFEADKKRWGDCYGSYQYDWFGWKKAPNRTWVTEQRICWRYNRDWPLSFEAQEPNGAVAVTCEGLKISILRKVLAKYTDKNWSDWKRPNEWEQGMVVKLCSREWK